MQSGVGRESGGYSGDWERGIDTFTQGFLIGWEGMRPWLSREDTFALPLGAR